MKRYEIRKHLSSNISDVQLRNLITSLQLPTGDETDYSDEQVAQIKAALAAPKRSTNSKRGASKEVATEASQQAGLAVSTLSQAGLSNAAAAIERIQASRDVAADQVSEAIASLLDPNTFLAECFARAASKLTDDLQEGEQCDPFAWGTDTRFNPKTLVQLPSVRPNLLNGA
jgi:hypothetical protein